MGRRPATLKPAIFLPFILDRLAVETANRLHAAIAQRFELDLPQLRVVAALGDGGPCAAQDIVRVSGMHKSTVSRAVAALHEQDWIEFHEDDADGRRAIMDFTPKGRRGFAAIAAVAAASEREWLSRLGRSRRSVLAALEKLQKAVDSEV